MLNNGLIFDILHTCLSTDNGVIYTFVLSMSMYLYFKSYICWNGRCTNGNFSSREPISLKCSPHLPAKKNELCSISPDSPDFISHHC